jgi:hypothetical protein
MHKHLRKLHDISLLYVALEIWAIAKKLKNRGNARVFN